MEIKIIRRKEKEGDQDYQEEGEGWRSRLSEGKRWKKIKTIRRKEKDGDQDYQKERRRMKIKIIRKKEKDGDQAYEGKREERKIKQKRILVKIEKNKKVKE